MMEKIANCAFDAAAQAAGIGLAYAVFRWLQPGTSVEASLLVSIAANMCAWRAVDRMGSS